MLLLSEATNTTIINASKNLPIWNFILALLSYIFLLIDSIIYGIVNYLYKVFLAIAQFKIFDDEIINEMVNRTYIVVGVVSIFLIAYALINAIINPDNSGKSDKSLSKIVKNFVFAVIGVALVPTIFNWFYYIQNVILCNNTIPKLLLNYSDDEANDYLENVGAEFSTYLFQAFFYPTAISNYKEDLDADSLIENLEKESGKSLSEEEKENIKNKVSTYNYSDFDTAAANVKVSEGSNNFVSQILGTGSAASLAIGNPLLSATLGIASKGASWIGALINSEKYSLADAYEYAKAGGSFWIAFNSFVMGDSSNNNNGGNSISDGAVTYSFILSTIAGGYCAYVLINMCIDMALRAVKLGYLEVIAPFTIMTVILPGKDTVFKNWKDKTISCALEVFVRVFVMSFAILIIKTVPYLLSPSSLTVCGLKMNWLTRTLIKVLIYCGILTFAKQAPKFFSEVTGIKSDGFKLGIADKLGEMALIGGAAKNGVQSLQGAATGAIGGLTTGFFNRDKINIKSAVMQGATQGFKGKGNQFSNQRKSTFQSIGGYEDKDQGIFGGESVVSKFINDHKKDVKNNYTEHGTQYKQKFAKEGEMERLKSEDNFSLEVHDKRKETFENGDINQAAKSYSEKKAEVAGVTSEEAKKQYRLEYLNNVMNTTTDVGVRRRIKQYLDELDADERVYNEIRALDEDSTKAWEKFKYSDEQISQEIENLTKSKSKKQQELERAQLEAKSTLLDAAQRAAAASRAETIEKEIKDIDSEIEVYNKLPNLKFTFDVTANNLAESVILGNGTLDMVSGIDYKKTLTDVEQKRVDAYRGFDAGVESATKTVDTQEQLLEEMKKMNKNSGQK